MEILDRAVSLDGAFEYTYYKGNVWVIKIPSVDYAKTHFKLVKIKQI